MTTPFLAGQAALWLQPNGPNTEPIYLGCHELDGPTQDKGDLNASYCPDEKVAGQYKLNGTYTTEPGLPQATVRTTVSEVLDAIEKDDCRGVLYAHKVRCGRRDLFTAFARSLALSRYHATSEAYSDMASRTPANEAESMYEQPYTAERLFKFQTVRPYRKANSGAGDLLSIATCSIPHCADDCGPAVAEGEYLVAVGTELAGSAADFATILISEDGGETWTPAAADPFAAGEDISAVICIQIDATTHRIIVARGVTDIANPAEIAYSDDGGDTWTAVNVGAVNGQYVLEHEGLYAVNPYSLWLVTTDGYIYNSADFGVTWVAQEEGVLTSEDLRQIMFEADGKVGFATGDNNTILRSNDEGESWEALAGPAGKAADEIYALHVISKNRVWIGYNDGELFYSLDGGDTWYERVWSGLSGTGVIADVAFANELEGYLLHNTAAPVGSCWRTINGGYTWQQVTNMPTNAGLEALLVVGVNHAFVVGAVEGTTPVILEIKEAA